MDWINLIFEFILIDILEFRRFSFSLENVIVLLIVLFKSLTE